MPSQHLNPASKDIPLSVATPVRFVYPPINLACGPQQLFQSQPRVNTVWKTRRTRRHKKYGFSNQHNALWLFFGFSQPPSLWTFVLHQVILRGWYIQSSAIHNAFWVEHPNETATESQVWAFGFMAGVVR